MKIFFLLLAASTALATAETDALRFRLLGKLMGESSRKLPAGKHCDFNTSAKREKDGLTIGEWMAWNLSFFDDKVASSITAKCAKAKKGRASCEVGFSADAKGESPWSCGFRFDETASGEIDFATFECTGSC